MEIEEETDILHEALSSLTKNSQEENRYFSPRVILSHVNKERHTRDERMPSTRLYDNLEDLVKNGRAVFIIGEVGSGTYSSNFYRSVKKDH
jgi:hypothetical protein